MHVKQIIVRQFGRRVPLHRQRQIIGVHALAVIFYCNQSLAARLERYLNPPRARVQSILHQLFNRRRRPLNNLARRNLINQI